MWIYHTRTVEKKLKQLWLFILSLHVQPEHEYRVGDEESGVDEERSESVLMNLSF